MAEYRPGNRRKRWWYKWTGGSSRRCDAGVRLWRRLHFQSLEARQLLSLSSTVPTATLTGLNGPEGMAFDSSGTLYVANSLGTTVSKFSPGSTTPTATLSGLNGPPELAFDTSGDLFVSNQAAISGTTVSEFAPGGTTPTATLAGLSAPRPVVIGPGNILYVANIVGRSVSEFSPGSTTPTATLLSGVSGANALALDSGGNLYVPSSAADTVSKITPGSTTASVTFKGLDSPDALAFDSSGDLFVANDGSTGNGTTVSEFALGSTTPTSTLTGLNGPNNLIFDSSENLYVSNSNGTTVSVFAPGSTTPTATLTGLSHPESLVFDSHGNLFVSNFTGNTVSEFAATTTPPVVTTTPGSLNYVVLSGAQVIDPGVTVVDAESSTISSATVTISSGYSSATDSLGFVNQNGITGSLDTTLGTLTLTGTSSVSNYQAALQSITFNSTTPSNSTRTVSFVVNDGIAASAAVTRTITLFNVTPTQLVVTGQPPSTVAIGGSFNFTVAAEDSLGELATTYSGSATVALANNPGGATLGGAATAAITNGMAVFSNLTLNKLGSGYTLQITSPSLSSTTSNAISVTPGAATQLLITGQPPATVTAGTGFGLTITAEDAEGDVATGYTGSVIVALAGNPAGGTLGGTTSVIATAGVAVFSGVTLNLVGGGYTLQASDGTFISATSSAISVTPGAATQLLITTQPPSSITAGNPFGFTVTAEDAEGNTVTSYSGSETVALVANPGGSTLGGTTSANASGGVAVFSGLTLNLVGSGYTLGVSGNGLTAATSSPISITPGSATHLAITSGPTSVAAGIDFGLTVAAEDAEGNVATNFAGSVSIALSSNPGGSDLLGTTTLALASGAAVFSGLTLNLVGDGYQLQASTTGLPSTTTTFDVVPGPVAQLIVTTEPPSTVTAGMNFELIVTAEDAEGNVASGFAGSVNAAIFSGPAGGTLSGILAVAASSSVATFSNLVLNEVGTGYMLQVSSLGLSSATTTAIQVTAGALAELGVTSGPPSSVTAGNPFGFTVTAEDAEGNTVSGFNGNVTVALANNPGGSTLSGTLTVAATNSVAVISGLTLNKTGTGYTLKVSSAGLSPGTTPSFSVVPGTATQLLVTTQPPATVTAGSPFGFTVAAEDANGNLATGFSGNATVALATNPGSGSLGGTLSAAVSGGVAVFSGLSLTNVANGYTLGVSGSGLASATTSAVNAIQGAPTTLTITGSANDNISIAFTDATHFTVISNGGTPATYSTANIDKLVYNGPAGAFSEVVFSDPLKTDGYSATQTFSSATLIRSGGGFEFDAVGVGNLYLYVSDSNSTATVSVAAGTGNFFVDATNFGYSYIANPNTEAYSELSGFGAETASGSGGSTYAYVYSTSHASFTGDPGGSTFTVGGVTSTLINFPQVYAVGAADGSDSMTLHTEGGSFVGQPSFSYVSGTFNGGSFLIGALNAANVTTQATHATDSAFFYSYAGNTFNGAQGTSSLTGSVTGFAAFATFSTQATGFQSLTVQESGSGTDVANLTSPGGGTFTAMPTVSSLVVGSVTVITVNTFFSTGGAFVAVPSKVNITGNSNGTDTANLYDAAGSNALVAQGNQATLTTPVNTVVVTQFGKVSAIKQSGTSDTVHQGAIDFALSTVGNWTSD